MIKNIGFIGIGTMGSGMVRNLLKKDFNVFVYNRTKNKLKALRNKNLHIVSSPKEACEKSQVVITCLPSDYALKGVLFSKFGVFKSLNNDKILLDCSTTSVDLTEKISKFCRKKGTKFLDAPMTGSKIGAESGTILFMIGGDKKTLEECKDIFLAMGSKIIHCGNNTYGQRAKIALNLVLSLVLQSYLEAIILGVKNGVSLKTMIEIFENSGAKSGVGSIKVRKIMKRDFSPHFKLELMNKDIGFAMKEIKKLKLRLPLSMEVSKVFRNAMKKVNGKEDFACIAKVLEKGSGVILKL